MPCHRYSVLGTEQRAERERQLDPAPEVSGSGRRLLQTQYLFFWADVVAPADMTSCQSTSTSCASSRPAARASCSAPRRGSFRHRGISPVIEFRDQLSPRRLMTLADLSKRDIEVRQLYHQIVDAIVNPRLPTLQNTDGDPIELTTVIYELGVTAAEAFDRLRPLATLRGEAHVDDERYDAAGEIEERQRRPGSRRETASTRTGTTPHWARCALTDCTW